MTPAEALPWLVSGSLLIIFGMVLASIYKRFYERRIVSINTRTGDVQDVTQQLVGTRDINALADVTPDWLRPPFDEFVEQCWQVEGTWYNHEQSSRYVHTAALLPDGSASYATTPATLTGLGILGTFVGIVVGLFSLAIADKIGDAQIQQLISGLFVSFFTSIFGLSLSLLATAQNAGATTQLEEAVKELQDAMDGLVERAVSPRILASMLEEQRQQLAHLREATEQDADRAQQQADHFTKLADYVAKPAYEAPAQEDARAQRLLQAIDQSTEQLKGPLDSLQHSMHEAMEQAIKDSGLVTALQDMASTLAHHQQEGAAELLQTFNDNLASNFGDSFGQLGASIEQMVQANSQYEVAMGQTTAQLQAGSQAQSEAASQMQAAATTVQGTVGQLDQAAASIQAAAGAIATMMVEHREALEHQRTVTQDVVQAVSAQTANWEAHQQAIVDAHDGLQDRFDALAATVDGLVAWHDRVRGALGEQLDSWSAAIDAQHQLTRTIGSERANWQSLVEQLGSATSRFETLGEALHGFANRLDAAGATVQDHLTSLQSAHEQTAEDVSGMVSELRFLNEQVVEKAAQSTTKMLEAHETALQRHESTQAETLATIDAQTAAWSEHQRAVQAAYGSIQDRFDALGHAVTQLATWHEQVQESLAAQIVAWSAAVDAQGTITSSVASERRHWQGLVDELRQATTGLQSIGEGLQGMVQGLDAAGQAMAQRIGDVQSTHAQGAEDVVRVATELQSLQSAMGSSFEDYAKVVGQLSAALPDVTALLDGLTAAVASQGQLVQQTDALAAGFRELTIDQAQLHDELGQMVEVTRTTKEAMSPTADALASSATGLTSAADTLAATQGQLKDMGAALEAVAQQLSERDRNAAQQWQTVQAAMVSTTEQLTAGADRYHEGVNSAVDRTFRDFDEGLAKAVKDMQSATGALHEIVQDMMALAEPVGEAK